VFCRCWSRVLCVHQAPVLCDQGSIFLSEFSKRCSLSEIELRITGIEIHPSLDVGERYHSPLRRVYQRFRSENPYAPMDSSSSCSSYYELYSWTLQLTLIYLLNPNIQWCAGRGSEANTRESAYLTLEISGRSREGREGIPFVSSFRLPSLFRSHSYVYMDKT
jgi:hypothetical protein